jgi:RHS repeat-associated protein
MAQDTANGHIHLHSGEFCLSAVDLEIPGRGYPWRFLRTYRSGITSTGCLGVGWVFNFSRRLIREGRDIIRIDGLGRSDRYLFLRGTFLSPLSYYTRLFQQPDGSFIEQDRHRNFAIYNVPDVSGIARLRTIGDRNSNTMTFEYNETNQLIEVVDTLHRKITYSYDEAGHLTAISDFIGRTITLAYEQDTLVKVTTPAVRGTPHGNNFPDGKTTRYSYSPLNVGDEQVLSAVTAPVEVASGGERRMQVFYEADPSSQDFGRVSQMRLGAVNDSNISAGGLLRYFYESLATPVGDLAKAVSRTSVINRNGNHAEYDFNQVNCVLAIRRFSNRQIRPAERIFETRYSCNRDGQVLRVDYPEGNAEEFVYDDQNHDRLRNGNLLSRTVRPDSSRGGDQALIRTEYTYEPIFNQLRTAVDARGNDVSFIPPNGGESSPERFRTRFLFDYQEGKNTASLAQITGLTEDQIIVLMHDESMPLGLGDLNDDGVTDQTAGNVVRVQYSDVHLVAESNLARLLGSPIVSSSTLFAYNGRGQLTRHQDSEGNSTVFNYYPENDPDGDGDDLIDGVTLQPLGYLSEIIRDTRRDPQGDLNTDPLPVSLRTKYHYDRVGNLTRVIDARGVATDYLRNERNQIIRVTRAADVSQALQNPAEPTWNTCDNPALPECNSGMIAFKYQTLLFYDANDNLVRKEIQNRDSNNGAIVGTTIRLDYSYDILGNVIEFSRDILVGERAITRFRYDRNENLVLQIMPMASLPSDDPRKEPTNVIAAIYDERDLLFQSMRAGISDQARTVEAHSDIAELVGLSSMGDFSTRTTDYDANGNFTFVATDLSGTGSMKFMYDGFDRLVSVVDAVGNQEMYNLDPTGALVRLSSFGPTTGPSPSDDSAATLAQPIQPSTIRQPLLREFNMKHDELGRMYERADRLFTYGDVAYRAEPTLSDGPLGGSNDGFRTTRYEYDRRGKLCFVISDDESVQEIRYDGVGRVAVAIDPEGNETAYAFDENGNPISVTETELSRRFAVSAGLAPDLVERFKTWRIYDSLNRLIRVTSSTGETTRFGYDSLDNLIHISDAQHSTDPADLIPDPLGRFPSEEGMINLPGNTTDYVYDARRRPLSEIRQLRLDGQGVRSLDLSNPANPDGLSVVGYAWDANGRLTARADDGGPLNQNTGIGVDVDSAHGNITQYQYDTHNRLSREIFADGTIRGYSYSTSDALTQYIDQNGSIVNLRYDRQNRLASIGVTPVSSGDPHPLGGAKDTSVAWSVVGTLQQTFNFDGLYRLTNAVDSDRIDPTSTGDDRVLVINRDSLNRVLDEVQGSDAVSSVWSGAGDRLSIIYPNGRPLGLVFDRLHCLQTVEDTLPLPTIAFYSYIGSDRVIQRHYANLIRATSLDDLNKTDAGFDNERRVVRLRHLQPNNSVVADFEYSNNRVGRKLSEAEHRDGREEAYKYDSLYRLVKRGGVRGDESFMLDGIGNRATSNNDILVNSTNSYTMVDGVPLLYDPNGNLIDDSVHEYQYDFANRLRGVKRKSDGAVIAQYSYDCLNRRTRRAVTNLQQIGIPDDRVQYVWDGWREIEDQRDGFRQQYDYGQRLDEPLRMTTSVQGPAEDPVFYHEDGRGNIAAISDIGGNVIERYEYDAYGQPSMFDAGGNILKSSPAGNPYFFKGRRFDPETGLYYMRNRYFHPRLGRFLTRDPLGVWADTTNLGNSYTFAGNDPLNSGDALGLRRMQVCFNSPEKHREDCYECLDEHSHFVGDISEPDKLRCVCDTGWILDVQPLTGTSQCSPAGSDEPSGGGYDPWHTSGPSPRPQDPRGGNGNPPKPPKPEPSPCVAKGDRCIRDVYNPCINRGLWPNAGGTAVGGLGIFLGALGVALAVDCGASIVCGLVVVGAGALGAWGTGSQHFHSSTENCRNLTNACLGPECQLAE